MGALLQVDLAPDIDDEDVDGAVEEALGMDFATRELLDDFVAVVEFEALYPVGR